MINFEFIETYLCPLLGYYFPQKYFDQDVLSREIIGLKNKDPVCIGNLAIKTYAIFGQINSLPQNIYLSRVPSHLISTEKSGVDLFIDKILSIGKFIDARAYLAHQYYVPEIGRAHV